MNRITEDQKLDINKTATSVILLKVHYLLFMIAATLWAAGWIAYLSLFIPLRRLWRIWVGEPQRLTYCEELSEAMSHGGSEAMKYVLGAVSLGAALGMGGFVDWATGFVPQFGAPFITHWMAIWFFTLLPCATIPSQNRRVVVYYCAFFMFFIELSTGAYDSKVTRFFSESPSFPELGASAIGFIMAYSIAYGLDKLAFIMVLKRPRKQSEPAPTFYSPIKELKRALFRPKADHTARQFEQIKGGSNPYLDAPKQNHFPADHYRNTPPPPTPAQCCEKCKQSGRTKCRRNCPSRKVPGNLVK